MLKSTEAVFGKIKEEIAKVIVGQEGVIDLLLITILSKGHAILQGVPGLAKTLLINAISNTLHLGFNRLQFTPDMVPSDITGTEIIDVQSGGEKEFRFIKGAVFTNILLADEINRTPPKTQSALLQSMQEQRVTILGKNYDLPDPFFVFATQNPIEYEGTYPLPEAQLDRFLLQIDMDYPSMEEEMAIIDVDTSSLSAIYPIVDGRELLAMQESASKIAVSEKVKGYAVEITRNTRPNTTKIDAVRKYVKWGAGPRATQMLVRAARSYSLLQGKTLVDKEAVDSVLPYVLKHRIVLSYNAHSDGVTVNELLHMVKKYAEAQL